MRKTVEVAQVAADPRAWDHALIKETAAFERDLGGLLLRNVADIAAEISVRRIRRDAVTWRRALSESCHLLRLTGRHQQGIIDGCENALAQMSDHDVALVLADIVEQRIEYERERDADARIRQPERLRPR